MPSSHDYIVDKRNKKIKIYIDGLFHERKNAKISVFDSGFLLGDGVWEGIRLYKKTFVHLSDHLDRLFDGAETISMKIKQSKNDIANMLQEAVDYNSMITDAHIRLIISRGMKSTPYQSPKVTISDPTIVIIPEYKKPKPTLEVQGLTLGLVKTVRDDLVQNPRVNSLSKHNCISACIEAEKLGYDEGLMLDPQGYVATCNSTNFFIIKHNEVWTSNNKYCLNGVTRKAVIRICKNNNIPVFEKNFRIDDVYDAEESFVTGTFAGIIPIVSIDNILICKGSRGPITKRLQALYKSEIEKLTLV
tara:strand:+ start:401 stop:1309 length:909 start_codon:yes stop_codon:yes gene_type:complete